jgi:hypothetical protein
VIDVLGGQEPVLDPVVLAPLLAALVRLHSSKLKGFKPVQTPPDLLPELVRVAAFPCSGCAWLCEVAVNVVLMCMVHRRRQYALCTPALLRARSC